MHRVIKVFIKISILKTNYYYCIETYRINLERFIKIKYA